MKSMQWVTILQPLLILLVPLIISQVKKYLGTNAQWIIPASAPIIGALIDFLQSFVTNTSLGPLQAAVYGGLGVWLRELYDQVKKSTVTNGGTMRSIIALFMIPLIALGLLTSCTTGQQVKGFKALDVTGTTLEGVGEQFKQVAGFYNQALDSKLITPEDYRKWAAFAKQFQKAYPAAVAAYKVAVAAGNAAGAENLKSSIQPMLTELMQFAMNIYQILNKSAGLADTIPIEVGA